MEDYRVVRSPASFVSDRIPAGRDTIRSVVDQKRLGGKKIRMDKEQLEVLRRQVEEDYKLDIAAIERLQRRFISASESTPSDSVPLSGNSSPNERSNFDTRLEPPDRVSPLGPAERKRDELEGSLRTMFRPQIARP
jgi:hypothetical protein